MTKHVNKKGWLTQALCALLCAALTVMLSLGGVLGGAMSVLGSEKALRGVSEGVLDDQLSRVQTAVTGLAEKYPFNTEAVLALADREAMRAYNAQIAAWWVALVQDGVMADVPEWSCPQIAETVMADEAFIAGVAASERRIVATEQVEAGVEQAMLKAALPLRAALLDAAFALVGSRIQLGKALLYAWMAPGLLLMASALTALLMLAVCARDKRRALPWIGGALMAAALVMAVALITVNSLDFAGQAGMISSMLAAEVRAVGSMIALRIGLLAGAAVLLGAGLTTAYQRLMKKTDR